MSRKSAKRRRGRPKKEHAKRNATTRQGRRTGHDPIDEGSPRLLQRKRRVAGGRVDLEISGAAVLLAHDHITREQFDRLGAVTQWLQLVARAWGGGNGSCAGLWAGILATLTRARTIGTTPDGADWARLRLAKSLGRLNGSRELVVALAEGRVPPLVLHVMESRLTAADYEDLQRLRIGLDSML